MNQIDLGAFLGTLSLTELKKLQKALPKAIEKSQKAEKNALRKKMEVLAAKSGYKLEDIISGNTESGKPIVKPKYMNPDNPSQTWSGRGRKPKWVENHLNKNEGNLDILLIK